MTKPLSVDVRQPYNSPCEFDGIVIKAHAHCRQCAILTGPGHMYQLGPDGLDRECRENNVLLARLGQTKDKRRGQGGGPYE